MPAKPKKRRVTRGKQTYEMDTGAIGKAAKPAGEPAAPPPANGKARTQATLQRAYGLAVKHGLVDAADHVAVADLLKCSGMAQPRHLGGVSHRLFSF
jgi:hypothetical protein